MIYMIFDQDRTEALEGNNVVGCHWYGGSDKAQQYNRWITEDNYHLQRGTLFKLMTKVFHNE